VNNKYEKTLKGITSLSFIGWALFVVLTKEEIVSAIEYFLPLSLKQSKGNFLFPLFGCFFF